MHINLTIKLSFIRKETSIPNKKYKLTKMKHQSKSEIILKVQIIEKPKYRIKIQPKQIKPKHLRKVKRSNIIFLFIFCFTAYSASGFILHPGR